MAIQNHLKRYGDGSLEAWREEARRRFGEDSQAWRFVCPACGHVACVADWQRAGAGEGEVAFSCVGRHVDSPRDAFSRGKGPCNYAGGGLFKCNPVAVTADGKEHRVFDFADSPPVAELGTGERIGK